MGTKRVIKEEQHRPQTLGAKHINRQVINGSHNRPNGGNERPSGWTDRPPQNNQAGTSRGPYPQKNNPTTPLHCLLCKGPHKLSYCPHLASLSALQVSIQESYDTGVGTMQDKKEDQDNPRMGTLKFLSALKRCCFLIIGQGNPFFSMRGNLRQ